MKSKGQPHMVTFTVRNHSVLINLDSNDIAPFHLYFSHINYNINMITRLFSPHLTPYFFSTAGIKTVGGKALADLPFIEYPTKPKPQKDQQLPMSVAYQTMNYLRKDKLPNCRYFAVEYKNRIYRFYNAYYYPMGRMINRVATEMRGRNSPHYRNHAADINNGDICVIVNIEDPLVTGKKLLFKKLRYHTGFVGHLKTFSYKHVLNHKPQLLYHYLLRRVMPKNKLSMQYLANVVLCRGPTHNFKQFPQFAPDKKRYSMLPQVDLLEMLKGDDSVKLIGDQQLDVAQNILDKRIETYYTEGQLEQKRRQSDEVVEDLTKIHQDVPKYKKVASITPKQFEVMKGKEKRIEQRYRPVRAPYKVKKDDRSERIKIFKSEKKARKDPEYELLKNEDLQEVDDENTAENPHIIGGGTQKKQ